MPTIAGKGQRGFGRWPSAIGVAVAFGIPAIAWGAGADAHPRSGPVLLALALLVLAAKAGGLVAERWKQPAVLGELLVGIGLGNLVPPLLGEQGIEFVRSDPTLLILGHAGILILLFDVGLEADLRALARVGLSSLIVALIGVAAPFLLGWGAAAWFLPDSSALVHIFIGATLTATSVGITVRVLRDLGVTRRHEGQIILGAALLDDVLGLLVLAVVGGMVSAADGGVPGFSAVGMAWIILRAVLFLGIAVLIGHFFSNQMVHLVTRTGHPEIMLVFGLGLCFGLAFAAESIGLADIIGAFAAGLMLDPYGQGVRVREDQATLSELLHPLSRLFVPLFFVLMGLQVHVKSLTSPAMFWFGVVLILCAVAGKLACAAGVVGRGFNRLAVAVGMIPRGEVGLIFAGIGSTLTIGGQPILSEGVFSAVVLMVLITTLVTPVGLRWAFERPSAA